MLLPWLDVGMSEDSCRTRREQAGENFAVLRHIALNLLNTDTSFKAGIKQKQKRAGRNNDYLPIASPCRARGFVIWPY